MPAGPAACRSAVGRGDHPHVDLDGLVAADALELALLEEAEQLDLGRRREIADLVEEQGAAVRLLEAAFARARRAGERTALVAEELALEQRLGQRRRSARARTGRARAATLVNRRATSSLPVPLSPVTSTEARDGATCSRVSNIARMTGLAPTSWCNRVSSAIPDRRRAASRRSRRRASAGSITRRTSSMRNGLRT
jgi:hypothetical protein